MNLRWLDAGRSDVPGWTFCGWSRAGNAHPELQVWRPALHCGSRVEK